MSLRTSNLWGGIRSWFKASNGSIPVDQNPYQVSDSQYDEYKLIQKVRRELKKINRALLNGIRFGAMSTINFTKIDFNSIKSCYPNFNLPSYLMEKIIDIYPKDRYYFLFDDGLLHHPLVFVIYNRKNFESCDLSNLDLSSRTSSKLESFLELYWRRDHQTIFEDSNFDNANLTNTNLSGLSFKCGASFKKAKMFRTNLDLATFMNPSNDSFQGAVLEKIKIGRGLYISDRFTNRANAFSVI
jgi:hypothetical protein